MLKKQAEPIARDVVQLEVAGSIPAIPINITGGCYIARSTVSPDDLFVSKPHPAVLFILHR